MTSVIGGGLESYMNRRAREQAKNRTAEAEEQAKQILEQAKADAERTRETMRQRTEQRIEARRQSALSQARRKAREILMHRREQVMEQVWQQARERLRQLDDAERLAAIRRLLQDAAEQLGGGALRIQVNEQDAKLLGDDTLAEMVQALKEYGVEKLSLAEAPAHIIGGVIVWRERDNELVDNSFDQRLALSRTALHDPVYRLLTGEAEE
ncbi:MAG: hypothetical protein H5T69_10555 [Chloroflexi bacterium]|nr:hypothetical protein [Chloroflexota bacterium]